MSYAYKEPPPAAAPLNVYGLIGLIASIISLFVVAFAPLALPLSIIGIILSSIGLRHSQKGMAIAGLVTGIFGAIISAVFGIIFAIYFGAWGACCCTLMNFAKEQMAQETAARQVVAPLLGKEPSDITLHGFSAGIETGPQQVSGQAVYTDETGAKKAVDFTVTMEKVDGIWKATNATLDSEPYDWVEPDYDYEDDFDDEESNDTDGAVEEAIDDGEPADGETTDGETDEMTEDQDPLDAVFDEPEGAETDGTEEDGADSDGTETDDSETDDSETEESETEESETVE